MMMTEHQQAEQTAKAKEIQAACLTAAQALRGIRHELNGSTGTGVRVAQLSIQAAESNLSAAQAALQLTIEGESY